MAGPRRDVRFTKFLVLLNALVPGALLAWDAAHGQLGVNGVNYALHTTGLLALIFLLLTLAITPVRKLTGWSTILAYRRALGLFAFAYTCTHFLIFFVFDRALSVSSTVHEMLNRRYLFIGTTALLLMTPLALTSTNAMQLRLGGRRWKALHRTIYVVASLGALHYYMLVKSDTRQPLAFAAVLALLLGYRLVRAVAERRRAAPARPTPPQPQAAPPRAKPRFWSGELRVAAIFDETPDVRTFRLMRPDGQPLPFEHAPGQYLNLALTIDGKRVNRSYTIASSPTRGHACEITVKRSDGGHGSVHLHESIAVGSMLTVSAPAGRFVFTGSEADRVVLIAGGVGITPLMAIIRYLTDRCWPGQIYLVYAARRRADLIFAEELAYLQRRFANLHVSQTLSREPREAEGSGWTGGRGQITTELLAAFIPELARGPVYLCGPDAMMTAMRALLRGLGLPDAALRTEAFVSNTKDEGGDSTADSRLSVVLETAAAPAPALPGASEAAGEGGRVRFQRSGQLVTQAARQTILETAEAAGIDLPFECRAGICGQCKTKLIAGRVTMDSEDALTAGEKARGFILACQAHPLGDIVLDA
jgi:ferredoxin-NADP reductase/DMSO/TMAO reductase YedYZ heme-binding membrane subunit